MTNEAPTSLSERILSDITERIVSGDWPPGSRVPFEYELADTYQCSRMTVNKAMTQLARSGLIERRRRSGSFVALPRSQAAVLEIHDIKTEVDALGVVYRYRLASREIRTATAPDRALLAVSSGDKVLALTCLHFAGGEPFCQEERLISLKAVPEAAGQTFTDIAPSPWLIAQVPWSAAQHTIRATGADTATASALDIAEASPCLVIERRTWSADQPVTFVRLTYPGDRHALVARFAPS